MYLCYYYYGKCIIYVSIYSKCTYICILFLIFNNTSTKYYYNYHYYYLTFDRPCDTLCRTFGDKFYVLSLFVILFLSHSFPSMTSCVLECPLIKLHVLFLSFNLSFFLSLSCSLSFSPLKNKKKKT